MRTLLCTTALLITLNNAGFSQEKVGREQVKVPSIVKTAFDKMYADAKSSTRGKEDGNFENNWEANPETRIQYSLHPVDNLLKL